MTAYSETTFLAADGVVLHAKQWRPSVAPRGALLFLHGLFEHGGRYGHLAERIAARGFQVVAPDLRGHGRSGGPRAWIRDFDQYVDDLARVFEASRIAGKPAFVFGYSMGGEIVTRWMLTRRPPVDGVLLGSPALSTKTTFPAVIRGLAQLLGAVWPRLRLVKVRAGRMSSDRSVAQEFMNDPLVVHGRFPIRIASELFRMGRRMWPDLDQVACPLLILHGTNDRLACIGGSRRLYERARSADKTLRVYEGLYHDLFHEPEKEQVIADVLAWLESHAGDA
jgi:alpha-beta hydrolase superfamily lysophospholipase